MSVGGSGRERVELRGEQEVISVRSSWYISSGRDVSSALTYHTYHNAASVMECSEWRSQEKTM